MRPVDTFYPAAEELDNFSHILEMEGVTVRRPEVRPGDFDRPVSTPDFESKTQLYAAMPRDVLIVVSATGRVGCTAELLHCHFGGGGFEREKEQRNASSKKTVGG